MNNIGEIDSDWNIGEIKFFDPVKGFGFVRCLIDEKEYYFNGLNVKDLQILGGNSVLFKLANSKRKKGFWEAVEVNLLQNFKLDNDFLLKIYLKIDNKKVKHEIFNILPDDYLISLAEQKILEIRSLSNAAEYRISLDYIREFKLIFKNRIPLDNVESVISNHFIEIADEYFNIKLWIEGYIKIFPNFNKIINYYLTDDEVFDKALYNSLSLEQKKTLFIICRDSDTDLLVENLGRFLDLEDDIQLRKEILANTFVNSISQNLSYESHEQIYKKITNQIDNRLRSNHELIDRYYYSFTNDFFKTKLWLQDWSSKEDYDLYYTNFIFLSLAEQIRFIKKMFFLLNQKMEGVSLEKILELKNLSFTYQEGKNYSVDFSVNIVLSSIEGLANGQFLNEENIFSLLTNQIRDNPQDLLAIGGFFEVCKGRSIPDKISQKEDVQNIISLKRIRIPRYVEFCEGVKFGGDGKDRNFKHDCWWCRGGSCYEANQSESLPNDYSSYTLSNFLFIASIPFDRKLYFDFIGLLNKIDNFLKHLKCRSCDYTLRPKEENYYSYYRISNFICPNLNCDKKEIIYLNHCLSAKKTTIKSKCGNLIDSRDTVRCNYKRHNPQSKYQINGPYICNLCGTCCSQKSLNQKLSELIQRKWHIQPGLEWKVMNKVGHLENNETFCYKCGNELIDHENNYNELVNDLTNPPQNSDFKVLSRGHNLRGFWFLVKAEEVFFKKAEEFGLRVNDGNGSDTSVKFIASGISKILVCSYCKMRYDNKKFEFIEIQEIG